MTELRWRSDALVKPRHALAAYVRPWTPVQGGPWLGERRRWLDKRAAEPRCSDRDSANSKRVGCLNAGRHESLNDVLSDEEVVSSDYAQHLQAATAHESRCLAVEPAQLHAVASSYCL